MFAGGQWHGKISILIDDSDLSTQQHRFPLFETVEKRVFECYFRLEFHRQGVRRRNRVWILRREVHGSRADDWVAERGSDGGQVPEHLALCLLRLESDEAGGS